MASKPSDFQRLESLFHELARLDVDSRQARLDELRESDPVLQEDLSRLLERDETSSERALLGVVEGARELAAGDWLGPYRLVRMLGKGGMGVVFVADQEEPLQRLVALKLVRAGLDSARVLARFEGERGTLARMAHPGVAQVFDAGTAPDGRPFFVMELVEGEPITTFCDSHRSTTAVRITLFRQVCDAVRHAHQKGVLHRDLKPANILVSELAGGPRVKVIDFGIAKLVGAEPQRGLTNFGELVGTPEYMSPEQARGSDVDTRSDVYSLGVVLYELLTGSVPIDEEVLRSSSAIEIARYVDESPPTPPAERLATGGKDIERIASCRRTEPSRLRRELRGDLGSILLMALRKEPERRYGSVEQFSLDLGHYLAERPVVARPDSLAYRSSKLFQRNTAAVVASLLLVVGLLLASVFSTRMYLQADAARRESEAQSVATEQINLFLKTMLSSIDPELARGRDVSLLREVLDDAAARIDGELGALPQVAADLELTVGRAYRSIGEEEEAERRLRASLARLSGLDPPRIATLAEAELALGILLQDSDQLEEAEELLRTTLERRRTQQPIDGPSLAASLTALASLHEEKGDYPQAEELFREALDIARKHAGRDVETLTGTLRGFGEHLMNHHQMAEAEALLREAVEVRRGTGQEGPSLVRPLLTLARWLRWSKNADEATECIEEAVEIARRELPEEHPMRLEAISELANLKQITGEHEVAEALFREALDAQRRVYGERHSSVATTANNLAGLLQQIGRFEEAEGLFAEATEGYVASFGLDHYWTSIARLNRARSLFELGRLTEAEIEVREAERIRTLQNAAPWQMAQVEVWLTACQVRRGEIGGNEGRLVRAIAALREHRGEASLQNDLGLQALIRAYELTGRREQADSLRSSLDPALAGKPPVAPSS